MTGPRIMTGHRRNGGRDSAAGHTTAMQPLREGDANGCTLIIAPERDLRSPRFAAQWRAPAFRETADLPNEKAPRLTVRPVAIGWCVSLCPHAGALAELRYAPRGRGL